MRKIVWPTAKRAGVTKRVGWHTFRRSLARLLIDKDAPVKLTQEIMRHANSRVTLEIYQQVSMKAKQALQARVVSEFGVVKSLNVGA
jgi:site-specific recombinase XerD